MCLAGWRKYPLNWPSRFQPQMNGGLVNPQQSRPFADRPRLALKLKAVVGSPVVILGRFGCPATIHRPAVRFALCALPARIVAVVVDTVDAVLCAQARPHVENEGIEYSPAGAYANPAPAVVRVAIGCRIVTASKNAAPASVFRGSLPLDRMTMPRAGTGTAARLGVSRPQGNTRNSDDCTAFATACPRRSASGRAAFDDGQLPIDVARLVFDPRTRDNRRIGVSHSVNLQLRFAKWSEPLTGNQPANGSTHCITRNSGGCE